MVMRVRVGLLGLAAGAALALGATAANADRYSAPARGYAAPYSWSGAYLGVNAGAVWGDVNGSLPFFAGAPFNVNLDPQLLLGVHGGYQHQFGNIVAGVEVGYSSTLKGDKDWGHTDPGASCGNVAPC